MADPADKLSAWPEYQAALKVSAEVHGKEAAEFTKASLEYGKLVVTNLHFMNAGGTASIPVILNFLNIDIMSKNLTILYVLPFSGYIIGLILVSTCALLAHKNFEWNAKRAIYDGELEVIISEHRFEDIFLSEYISSRKSRSEETSRERDICIKKMFLYYSFSYLCGFLSCVSFIVSSALLGVRILS